MTEPPGHGPMEVDEVPSIIRSSTFDDSILRVEDEGSEADDSFNELSSSGAVMTNGEEIRCICDSTEDDGFTIQCEDCLVWQHALCVGISKDSVPDRYFCEVCRPDLHLKGGFGMTSFVALSSAGPGRKRRISSAVSLSKTNLTEIGENMVSRECAAGFDFLASKFYEDALLQSPKPSPSFPSWRLVNFEFSESLAAFPGEDEFRQAMKALELREIRGRGAVKKITGPGGYANLKLGVFANQNIDPGTLVTEYLGQVQVAELLHRKGPVEKVHQSFVLFIPRLRPLICVDARKYGNVSRHIRRSCRPNCDIKLVLTGGERSSDVHIGLFARNTIQEGEEVLLPIDVDDGNAFFRYECACGNADFCLAPEPFVPVPKQRTMSAAGYDMVDTLKPRSKTPQPSAAAASHAAGAKLSREERKLMQYIEQIEKMDQAEKKSASRKSSSTMGSSAAGMPPGSDSPSPKSSPKKPQDAPSKRKDSLNQKRSHEELEKSDAALLETLQEVLEEQEGGEPVKPKTKRPPGRPPKSPSKKTQKAPSKTKKTEVLSGDEPLDEILQEKEAPTGKKPRKKLNLFADEEVVDVMEADNDVPAPLPVRFSSPFDRASSASPFSSYNTTADEASAGTEASTSLLETPSKKRVSLSEYMKKRKATTEGAREEGELPPPPPPPPPASYQEPRAPQMPSQYTLEEPKPRYTETPKYSYDMPPHLTPPPPLQGSGIQLTMGSEYQLPRSESTSSQGYGHPRQERKESYDAYGKDLDYPKEYSKDYHPKEPSRDYPSAGPRYGGYQGEPAGIGASRYGYSSKPSAPPTQSFSERPYPPYDQPPQPYRPRPSLLKAAQDLPTRWEEGARYEQPSYRGAPPPLDRGTSKYGDPYRREREYDDYPPRGGYPPRDYYDQQEGPSGVPPQGPPYPPHRGKPYQQQHHPNWRRHGNGNGGTPNQGGNDPGYPRRR